MPDSIPLTCPACSATGRHLSTCEFYPGLNDECDRVAEPCFTEGAVRTLLIAIGFDAEHVDEGIERLRAFDSMGGGSNAR